MKKLVTFDLAKLRSLNPCYDPVKYLPEDWQGTVVDILEHKDIPPQDRLWAVCRGDFLSTRLLRRFAIAQARTCRKNVIDKTEFDRILQVCRRFTEGRATAGELEAAWLAANMAAESAAHRAAESAAYRAAGSAVLAASGSAARLAAFWAAHSAACRMLLRMIRVDLRSLK